MFRSRQAQAQFLRSANLRRASRWIELNEVDMATFFSSELKKSFRSQGLIPMAAGDTVKLKGPDFTGFILVNELGIEVSLRNLNTYKKFYDEISYPYSEADLLSVTSEIEVLIAKALKG